MVTHGLERELETMRLDVAGPLARLTLDRPEVLNAGDARWAFSQTAFAGCLESDEHRRAMEEIRARKEA